MNSTSAVTSEKQWEHLLANLSPNKIVALEKSLKSYQNKYQGESKSNNNKENNNEMDDIEDMDINVKSEPVITTKPFINNHRTKNRGLTYENGRRNLKAERVSTEEMDRRAKRRERNRIAAAKCRERRQLQLDELQQQVDMLRSTEFSLQSTLKQLETEELELRSKLSNHNCVISESNDGELSIMIPANFNHDINKQPQQHHQQQQQQQQQQPQHHQHQQQQQQQQQYVPRHCFQSSELIYEPMPTIASSHSVCRPRSLPVPCQNCTNISTDSFFDKTPSLDRLVARDDSLTPLLSPDTFSLLKGQLKTENTPNTPIRTMETKPNIKLNVKSEANENMAFSWNNSIVDQLSMSCSEPSNAQYLSTPVVDMSYYSNGTFSSQLNSNHNQNAMEWHSSH